MTMHPQNRIVHPGWLVNSGHNGITFLLTTEESQPGLFFHTVSIFKYAVSCYENLYVDVSIFSMLNIHIFLFTNLIKHVIYMKQCSPQPHCSSWLFCELGAQRVYLSSSNRRKTARIHSSPTNLFENSILLALIFTLNNIDF